MKHLLTLVYEVDTDAGTTTLVSQAVSAPTAAPAKERKAATAGEPKVEAVKVECAHGCGRMIKPAPIAQSLHDRSCPQLVSAA